MSIKSKIQSLITAANTATGESDTTLTDAVQTLVDGYGQGGGGETKLSTGTFTLSSVSATVEIASDFEPDYIFIQGDLVQDVSLWGVKMLWIVRDNEALMMCDTSQTASNISYYGSTSISDLNGSSTTTNNPSANYANNVLTVNTRGNRNYTDFCPGVEYRYFLYAS